MRIGNFSFALSLGARFGVAVSAALAAILSRLALDPVWGTHLPFITLYPAIMLSAWLGGFWPGAVTTGITGLAAFYFWIAPARSWQVASPSDLLGLLVFVLIGMVISALNEAWRRAQSDRLAMLDQERVSRDAAEHAEERLRVAIRAGRLGSWEWLIRSGRVNWSPELEAIHGYAPGTFPGTIAAFQAEIHPEDRERVGGAIARAIAQRNEHHIEYRIVRTDGQVRWVEGRGQLFLDGDGEPERMVGVCTDVTERKCHEERLRQANQEAEQASRLKDQFLAIVSHELRSPINAILGWADLLHADVLDETQRRRAIEALHLNAKRQTQLIDDLLDVSRIVSGNMRLARSAVDLREVVRTTSDDIRLAADAKQIRLDVQIDPAIGPVFGDAVRLQQILTNLLNNAVKFAPPSGWVRLQVRAFADGVELTVSDSGPGIADDFLPFIFEPFRQADASNTRVHGGLGLGLAIVKNLVEAHQGTISVVGRGEECGAIVTVHLPALSNSAHEADDAAPSVFAL